MTKNAHVMYNVSESKAHQPHQFALFLADIEHRSLSQVVAHYFIFGDNGDSIEYSMQ